VSAGVDLDEIVDEEHLHDAEEIDGGVGVLGEEDGHEGDVPGVLGVGLLAAAADGVVLATDFLSWSISRRKRSCGAMRDLR
jgi:hypothetical protein